MTDEQKAKALIILTGIVNNRWVSYGLGLVFAFVLFYWVTWLVIQPFKWLVGLF